MAEDVSKDHDLLVQTFTLQQVLIEKIDKYIESNDKRFSQVERGLSDLSLNQVRTSGDITSLKGMFNSLDERMDALDSKSFRMDMISYTIAAIAGIVAWFK